MKRQETSLAAPQEDRSLKGSVRLGNYLRRLRSGYGYSLRRVEERARAVGGEIDNSQLSRYEKGICYPSFDKLRVLASVFNVPIQAFSDVVDLEAYESLKPAGGRPQDLVARAEAAMREGDTGLAFACFERAIELLEEEPQSPDRDERIAWVRIGLATALSRLSKLSLAEQEIRHALRTTTRPAPLFEVHALLALANIHADQGDLLLAELEAERAQARAQAGDLPALAAQALHTEARVLAQRHQEEAAIERYRRAAELYEAAQNDYEATRVRINIGLCYVGLGKPREAVRLLREALAHAQASGYKRLEAQALSSLGEAYYRQGSPAQARACFQQSDAIAGAADPRYPDLLFVNAFYEWRMAIEEGHPTRERIAFGRLKALRGSLERRFPEVEAFDAYVERGRRDG
jgi:tetratricopeptide (TPR) repeat protein